jgi:hypothetical protein
MRVLRCCGGGGVAVGDGGSGSGDSVNARGNWEALSETSKLCAKAVVHA